MKVIREVI